MSYIREIHKQTGWWGNPPPAMQIRLGDVLTYQKGFLNREGHISEIARSIGIPDFPTATVTLNPSFDATPQEPELYQRHGKTEVTGGVDAGIGELVKGEIGLSFMKSNGHWLQFSSANHVSLDDLPKVKTQLIKAANVGSWDFDCP